MNNFLAVLISALIFPVAVSAATPNWLGSWAASPVPVGPASNSFSDQTLRQVLRLSAGGQALRVRLSNEYGTKPLVIGEATVTLANADGSVAVGESHGLTFGGNRSVTIPPGAPLYSDPVTLKTSALTSLSISLYLPDETGPCTCHGAGAATVYVSEKGNHAEESFVAKETLMGRAFITEVDVQVQAPGKTVVVFGDSLSDGYRSNLDANHRWPDRLAERLIHARGAGWSVVNAGISGNRLLMPGSETGIAQNYFGDPALARFDRDVLSVPNGAYLIVFEGINDIGMGSRTGAPPSAESLIAAYRQLIERAHAKHMTVIGATLAPFEGASYYSAAGEATREAVNTWIRKSKAFDGVIDFDAVWKDPMQPTRMRPEFQADDWLHANDAGYQALGDAVDLRLFSN